MRQFRQRVTTLFAVTGIAVLASGVFPVGLWLQFLLTTAEAPRQADAIVVLGGGIYDQDTLSPGTAERLIHGLRLWKKGYASVIILTGGNPANPAVPESDVMARVAIDLGIPQSSLIVERHAANTHAQAHTVGDLARRHNIRTILLVTSPVHSYRAVRVFQKTGLTVVSTPAAPLRWVRFSLVVRPPDVLARIGALAPAVYEWGAITLYWARGWL